MTSEFILGLRNRLFGARTVTTNDSKRGAVVAVAESLTPIRFAVLLGVLLFAAFPDVILGSRTFFFRDFALFGYPLAHYHRECFWRGEVPLWNPFNNCGLPFLAQWNTLTCYPLSLIYLSFPLSWSLGVFCIVHLYLAGIGMYFLARRWTQDNAAAAFAGLVFAFNGLSLNCLMWPNNIAALGWMPWVVLLAERAWREGGGGLLLAGLAGAMQVLAGAPEVILLTWAFTAALWGVHLFRSEIPRAVLIRRVLAVSLIVAGLTAVQMLPLMDMLIHSQRNRTYADSRWSMPWWGVTNFFVPLNGCFEGAHGVYSQTGQNWTHSYYLGISTVLLAGFAMCRVRTWRVWLLTGSLLGALILALGDQGIIYRALQAVIPIGGFLRYPIKFVILAAFVLPLLAAFGLKWILDRSSAPTPKGNAVPWIMPLVIVVAVGVILAGAWLFPLAEVQWTTTFGNALWRLLFLVIAVGLLALLPRVPAGRPQLVLTAGLLFSVWLDVMTHAPRLSPTVERWVYDRGIVAEMLPQNPAPAHGSSRAMIGAAAQHELRFSYISDPIKAIPSRRVALFCNLNLLEAVPKVNGFYSLYFREEAELIGHLYAEDNPDYGPLLDFMAVSHMNTRESLFDWNARPTAMPMIFGGQRPIFGSDAQIKEALLQPSFQPREVVYLPATAQGKVIAKGDAQVHFLSRRASAHEIEIEVEAAKPSIVTIAQAYFHRWKARVNGKPVPLLRANYAFQAVEIPAGRVRVELIYDDWVWKTGFVVSACTLLLCAGAWLAWRRRSSVKPC